MTVEHFVLWSTIGCGVLVAGPELGIHAEPGEWRVFCDRDGLRCGICQTKWAVCQQLTRALQDTARIDTMDRNGWSVHDGGDQVDLNGRVPLREAMLEYCKRFEIPIK